MGIRLHHGLLRAQCAMIAASVTMVGCSSTPPPVPLRAARADLEAMVGHWSGSYRSDATGASGSILFELHDVDSVARGDVMMVPESTGEALRPRRDHRQEQEPAAAPRTLEIEFISVSRDRVLGSLAPFLDPACDCARFTTFEGRIEEDRISGTYVSRSERESSVRTGTWFVDRQ